MELVLQNVEKQYKTKKALADVSLVLTEGIYGLLGPNGAGKSTLMNLITGNVKASAGRILWNGEETAALGAAYRGILGYAPQQQGLYETFSGRRFLSYMAALKDIPKKEVKAEVERVLALVNLTDRGNSLIGSYSGGMKQRLLIAQAVMGNPKLVVLDEPTAGLDPKERIRIREKIKEISGDKIILVSTHVISDIWSIAKEIIFLKEGRIAACDTISALCEKHGGEGNPERIYMEILGEDALCLDSLVLNC